MIEYTSKLAPGGAKSRNAPLFAAAIGIDCQSLPFTWLGAVLSITSHWRRILPILSGILARGRLSRRIWADLPLLVVTAGDSLSSQRPIGGFSAQELNAMHQELQRKLAGMSSDSQHVVIEGASHLSILAIPAYAEQIADAIKQFHQRIYAKTGA